MGIGACIVLIAVGAILTFATDLEIFGTSDLDVPGVAFSGIDTDAVGVILMIVGVLGLVATTLIFRPRSRSPRDRSAYY